MNENDLVIYGAYGYTGELVVQRAVDRGWRPLLAGRNPGKLADLADKHSLPHSVVRLSDRKGLRRLLSDCRMVLHLAGPYAKTARPMLDAAIDTSTDYIDVSGELHVLEEMFSRNDEAARADVTAIPACGFEVVPTDGLAGWLQSLLPDATSLELAVDAVANLSAGTLKATTGVIAHGAWKRRDGRLEQIELATAGPRVRFHRGEKSTIASPLAELETSWRTTGIPDISTYLALPIPLGPASSIAPVVASIMKIAPVRRILNGLIDLVMKERRTYREGSASIWGRATTADGRSVTGLLKTEEPYLFTSESVLAAVETLAAARPRPGILTPTQAFGHDFVLKIPGTERTEGGSS